MRANLYGLNALRSLILVFILLGIQVAAFSSELYRIGSHDVIRIEVFGEEDLTKEIEVDDQGLIKYPLLGKLEVRGLTVREVENSLATKLKAGYLIDPKVTVSIVQYRKFYVHGEARNPGAYSFRPSLTVLKAVALAGGFTDKADKKHIKVIRMVAGKERWITIQIDDLIQPDDVLIIPDETNIVPDGPF